MKSDGYRLLIATLAFCFLFGSSATAENLTAKFQIDAPTHIQGSSGSFLTSLITGNTWVQFTVHLTNTSSASIWLDGYSINSPFYSLFTRANASAPWTDYNMGYCGTGAERYELKPNATTSFNVAVPKRYIGKELRVELYLFAGATNSISTILSSNPVLIK